MAQSRVSYKKYNLERCVTLSALFFFIEVAFIQAKEHSSGSLVTSSLMKVKWHLNWNITLSLVLTVSAPDLVYRNEKQTISSYYGFGTHEWVLRSQSCTLKFAILC